VRFPAERSAAAWLFVAPALVLIGVFFFLPVAASLLLSVTDFDIYAVASSENTRLVGFDNYARLLRTPLFWSSLRNTFYFALVGGPLTIAVSLAAALLLNAKLVRWKSLFRTIYFTPFVTTLVAVAIVWRYLYHTRYGLLNYALGAVGAVPIDWLGDPRWAMPAIILMTVWKSFGYNMLIFIAGLQAIPEELYEAARIDGASAWQRFRHVTLPLLMPTLVVAVLLRGIDALKTFDILYATKGKGGGSFHEVETLNVYAYGLSFDYNEYGVSSAVLIIFFLIIIGSMWAVTSRRKDAS